MTARNKRTYTSVRTAVWVVIFLSHFVPAGQDSATLFAEVTSDKAPLRVHKLQSPNQAGETNVFVLLPDAWDARRRYRALYVLPVEAGEGKRWGDPIDEVRKHDLHNRHQLVCVFPTFSDLPWYADHATDPKIRQESYVIRDVVPLIDAKYATQAESAGRLLVGFSKSGWGAWSLLLRHPDLFGRAAAWDAPLMMDKPDRFGTGPIFGTAENFDRYRIDLLVTGSADRLAKSERLVLLGHGNFKQHHDDTHELLQRLAIPHAYRVGPRREHSWNSGWLPEAISLLVADAGE